MAGEGHKEDSEPEEENVSRYKSSSIDTGAPGDDCPKCGTSMVRREHPKGWVPRIGQPFYYRYWDMCPNCSHLQHYDDAKVYAVARSSTPQRELTPDQLRASRAIKDRCTGMTSKRRRQWLAEQMGIEERYAIISQFDAVECATVIEICAERPRRREKAA